MKLSALPLILATLACLQTACGRDTKIYADPAAAVATTPGSDDDDATNTTDGRNFLPRGFFNQSVNHATVELTKADVAIRLATTEQTNEAGGFNDTAALGNRALLGLSGFDQKKLSELKELHLEAKGDEPSITLIIDLDCDAKKTLAFSVKELTTTETAKHDSYTRYSAKLETALLITDDADFAAAGVKSSEILSKHPSACLRNGRSGAADLPLSLPTAALLIGLGDKSNLSSLETLVKRIEVISAKTDVFDAADWEL